MIQITPTFFAEEIYLVLQTIGKVLLQNQG